MLGLISVPKEVVAKFRLPVKNGKVQACTFDYWETLVEEREKGAARIEKISRELVDLPFFSGISAEKLQEAVEKRWLAVTTLLSAQPFEVPIQKFIKEVFAEMGKEIDQGSVEELTSFISEKVHEQTLVLEGAVEFLSFLKEKGIKIGLISNTQFPRILVEQSLKKQGLLPYFDSIVLSSEVSWRKPHLGIFREGLKRLKVKPENTLHFGDSPYYDVEGAKRAGIFPVQVLASRFHPPLEAEVAISDWRAAKMLFLRLWG